MISFSHVVFCAVSRIAAHDGGSGSSPSAVASGSGPAYVFYFMQSLISSAKSMGFTQSEAELLTYQTFRGAVDLFNKYDISCDEWIKKVSSKGGTTEAAIEGFNKRSVQMGFQEGVLAALNRAEELAKN